ncbi:ATP-binding sensor histidine kinase [Bradyrhizobium uaiense]|uniref:histidine kinase n=1 Tax=Bradyrhizobium uaiense TaxID=2594946 RepID=A0A6P1B7Z6_9BRAD|nr:AAA family ATPase [Bradyrhizobium uaiense]
MPDLLNGNPDGTSQVLWEDGERVFCRAWRSGDDGNKSAVLIVMPAAEHPARSSIDRLAHEYALRDELDRTWAVQPLGFTNDGARPVLMLDDTGGEPLHRLLGAPMDVGGFLCLAIGIATALGKLHERGLVHKDIKPANILVNATAGDVRLTGFGIASRLSRERQVAGPPETLAGTLAYMAPEQTGRMNRSIDSRSDLYALGVTFYQMLTGSLPFAAADPVEWIHCHTARKPVPPSKRRGDVPCPVSAMILKLLAKTAEDRYQTAAGLERDLRRCLAEWESRGAIDEFQLGKDDTPDRLLMPGTLYGREREVEALRAALERVVKGGGPELVLVSGYSGIGKSSVVHELHKALVPPRGLFASGKFDQYKRDIPYATLGQALQGIVRPLLSRGDIELGLRRDSLLEALGSNGRLMVDLVSELTLVIGEQPQVPELAPRDAQRRFQMVFQRFVSVFARPEHPLVLFLDDLQWLDPATLDLLDDLLTHSDLPHLLLIGAYRDNEADATHPLIRKLEAIRSQGGKVKEITLAPLSHEHLGQLVADALRCDTARAAPLARLVQEKTAGNPFFATQFLRALADERLLTFDHGVSQWTWDLDRIRAKGYTENVVELMVGKIARLPAETQTALQQLACLGNAAEPPLLALTLGTSEADVDTALQEAVHQGLVDRFEGRYRFSHDRVQEAAYSLMPEALRAEAHLGIGRLLAATIPEERRSEAVFDIVNQLNRGASRIDSPEEREQAAKLNLLAGKRARASTAYASALNYLADGRALLPQDPWGQYYRLAFDLEFYRAECEFLTGALADADERLSALSGRAMNSTDGAAIARLRLDLYTTLGRNDRAVEVSLEHLRQTGIDWNAHPSSEEVRREYTRVWRQLGDRPIEDLAALPIMTDPLCLSTLEVLASLQAPARFTNEHLPRLVAGRMTNISLEHGNSDASPLAYVRFGQLLTGLGDYRNGLRFGKLGVDLVEKAGLGRFKSRVYLAFGHSISPWNNHVNISLGELKLAFEAAEQVGDLTFASYARSSIITLLLFAGEPLNSVDQQCEDAAAFIRKARFDLVAGMIGPSQQLIKTLRGRTDRFGSFTTSPQFDEREAERFLATGPQSKIAACWYWIRKLQARFFAHEWAAAVEAGSKARQLLWTSQSNVEEAEYLFYGALALAAHYDAVSAVEQAQYRVNILGLHARLRALADNCPENFANRAALVGAEIARIDGRALDAMDLYERAIRSARASGFVHNEALACEIAARFYAARGFDQIAPVYLRNALDGYLRWGADGKAQQLVRLHPGLGEKQIAPGPTNTIGTSVEQLDLATVIKLSQAVSGTIVQEQLLTTVMRTAIEHAGAERGVLILSRSCEPRIVADATIDGDAVIVRLCDAAVTPAALPEAVLHYVQHTRESVVLDDAATQNAFSEDPYIRARQARSILGLSLVTQANFIGMLYLENNLVAGAFAPARITVLKLLAAQAAISLENTQLYRDLAESERRYRETQMELTHANRVATMGQLTASIAHEVNQPIAATKVNAQAALRWLNRDAPNLEEVRRLLARIVNDGDRAGNVVSRIRDLVKNAPPQMEPLHINSAISEVIELTRSEATRSGVSVHTQFAEGLPAVKADRTQLQQVILNLILNAFQAMGESGMTLRELQIGTEANGPNNVLITVRDSGPGISPQSIERLFHPFYTTKQAGMGMGLAICRSIVEGHGGRIWAAENVPRGAAFHFTLVAAP